MKFVSSRNHQLSLSIDEAILQGLAADGGLVVVDEFPIIDSHLLSSVDSYASFAAKLLEPFFRQSTLTNQLDSLCHQAFNFELKTNSINENTTLLELFHGPTLSFKDFGARFLAVMLNALSIDKLTTVMVATSGDTGSAVASSLSGLSNVQVVVLYPNNKISPRQRAQMCSIGGNVQAIAVDGDFDDCQRLVKSAFTSPWFTKHLQLTTANSINIARVLAQMVYYAYSAQRFCQRHHLPLNIVVPSGNLGNVTACLWAKAMGAPIDKVAIATNANRVVSDYVRSGTFSPRATIETIANAMDVGAPSNFERLDYLLPKHADFCQAVSVASISDERIKQTIKHFYADFGVIICPHTAAGCAMREQLSADHWYIAATAHPAKFEQVIEPLLSQTLKLPTSLAVTLSKPQQDFCIEANLAALERQVDTYFSR